MEDLFLKFTVGILKLNKLVQRIKVAEMKKFGLKSVHVMCIYYLNEHRDGLTATDLVKLTLEDKAAISRALSGMRQMGYVDYNSSSHNAPVRLTQKGVELAAYISTRIASAVDAGSENFTPEQRDFFYKSLISISEKLEKYYNELPKHGGQDGE